ncbi:hypothetical protein O3G_MSEX007716 [Manduca sexta]|uniref:Uncharacterized protein n=1 Tax=Manduca sexta TaxID=7130 RepID=A0A921Z8U2_MANSE|nr:hypothetical protein O3G_MSEX007716 [Manduca sexta]
MSFLIEWTRNKLVNDLATANIGKVFILPRVRWLGERVEGALSGIGGADRLAAGNLKHQLLKVLAPVVKQLRQPPDLPDEYKREYGYLGPSLQQAVSKIRASPAGGGGGGGAVAVVTCTPPLLPAAHHAPKTTVATRNVVIASPAPPSPAPSTPPPQKFVIVTSQQKPPQSQSTSGQGHIVVHSSQPTIVRNQNVQVCYLK